MVPWSVHGKPHLFGSYKKQLSNHMVPVTDDDDDDVGWFGSKRSFPEPPLEKQPGRA